LGEGSPLTDAFRMQLAGSLPQAQIQTGAVDPLFGALLLAAAG